VAVKTESMRNVAILGSTGSIGTQTLDVVARHPHRFRVVAIAAGSRIAETIEQAKRFSVSLVSCAREEDVAALRAALPRGTRVEFGAAGLLAVAAESGADVVVAATDVPSRSMRSLRPSSAAFESRLQTKN
jgi:1-deoxy-D-xylulose-5-phosphate reductoisomerase